MTRIALIIGAILVAGAMALPASTGEANSYTVTKTADTFDGVCNADCSLREAVWAANNIQGPHTIDIPGGGNVYTLTIPGANEDAGQTGDLDINTEVEIFGDENPIIQMSSTITDRVFHVHSGPVTIAGVTIRGGSGTAQGGGILNLGVLGLYNSTITGNSSVDGGGIISNSPLTIVNSTFSNNSASSEGGGLFSYGSVNIIDSTFSGNTASTPFQSAGGGIFLFAPTSSITNTTVANNTAGYSGGGIYFEGGANTITGSTIRNNSSGTSNGAGGGIYQIGGSNAVTNTTISSNYSPNGGAIYGLGLTITLDRSSVAGNGALYGGGVYNYGAASITNSTISGNGASVEGGGIFNTGEGGLTLSSSTVTGNVAGSGGAIYNWDGQIPSVVTVKNSILADSPSGGNCTGNALNSVGFNLSSDGACALTGAGDLNNAAPNLGPLAYDGGPTPTHALLEGSQAADGGGPGCPATDQRGVARPRGLRCDIGAYEAPDTDSDGASDPADLDDDNDNLPDNQEIGACRTMAEDYDAFQDIDGCPDPDNDEDDICDPGQTSISCVGSDSGKYCFDPAGTLSCPTTDCRNAAEDADAFKDSDGCPEPDNDNDGKPDGIDACPGTGSLAGANGMLGSPQDLNHNGIRDGAEAAFTSDDSTLTFEDYDGVLDGDGCHDSPGNDFDGDGLTDDIEVFTLATDPGNPDSDADAITDGTDNCPNWANASQAFPLWTIPANDSDCDGFNLVREQHVGTDPTKHCNDNTGVNNEPDAWPGDFNDNQITNLPDVISFGPTFNKLQNQPGYNQRYDLNVTNQVLLSDVILMGQFFNKLCA